MANNFFLFVLEIERHLCERARIFIPWHFDLSDGKTTESLICFLNPFGLASGALTERSHSIALEALHLLRSVRVLYWRWVFLALF